jgi:hypothetical protein
VHGKLQIQWQNAADGSYKISRSGSTAIHNVSHQIYTPKMSGIEVIYLVPEWKVSQSHGRSTSQSYQNIPYLLTYLLTYLLHGAESFLRS